jgi:tRNA uridine 5-carbamoylmethylation protein Kti12
MVSREDDGVPSNDGVLVIMVCGLPGAGKSLLVREWTQQSSQYWDKNDVAVLEYDELEERLWKEAEEEESWAVQDDDESRSLRTWRRSRKVALEQLSKYLLQKDNDTLSILIMVDNFYLRSMRKQIYRTLSTALLLQAERISSRQPYYLATVWLDTPVSICLERNQGRKQAVPDDVIARMHKRFESPLDNPETWERAFTRLDGCQAIEKNVKMLEMFVQSIIAKPDMMEKARVQPSVDDDVAEQAAREAERSKTKHSVAHNKDLLLRACVQAVAKANPQAAKPANIVRKELLQEQYCADSTSLLVDAFLQRLTVLTEEERVAVEEELQGKVLDH